jgi:hypothetical protein
MGERCDALRAYTYPPEETVMGGPPSKQTKADKRLKDNQPAKAPKPKK